MNWNLNSPYNSNSFPGPSFGKKLVLLSYETPEYYADKGLVCPWQRNRKNTLMARKELRDGFKPVIGNWRCSFDIECYLKRLLSYGHFKKDIYEKWNSNKISVEEFVDLAKDEIIKSLPEIVYNTYKWYLYKKNEELPRKVKRALEVGVGDPLETAKYWDAEYRKEFVRLVATLKYFEIDAEEYVSNAVLFLDNNNGYDCFMQSQSEMVNVKKLAFKNPIK